MSGSATTTATTTGREGALDPPWRVLAVSTLVLGLVLQLWLWNRVDVELGSLAIGGTVIGSTAIGSAGVGAPPQDSTSTARLPCLSTSLDSTRARDQIDLLAPGIVLARRGEVLAVAKSTSGNGLLPGPTIQALVGWPLRLRYDYRAASAVIVGFHLLAALLLWRLVAAGAGEGGGTIYLALFWLGPWRLYHSGHLWEPAYVLLPAALHLLACWRSRESARASWSALLAASVVLGMQLHSSVSMLAPLAALLWLRRAIRLHPLGLIAGGAVGALPLLPMASAMLAGTPPVAGAAVSIPMPSVVERIVQTLKGLVYWLRLGSPDVGRRLRQSELDVGELPIVIVGGLAGLLVPLAAYASWRFLCPLVRGRPPADEHWAWLRSYSGAALLCAAAATLLSPVTPQGWHLLVLLPAASLPIAWWFADGDAPARWRLWLMIGWIAVALSTSVVIGLGHPLYDRSATTECTPFEAFE